MQATSVLPMSPNNFNFHGFSKVSSEMMSEDFSAKLKLDGTDNRSGLVDEKESESEPAASLGEKEEREEDFEDEDEEDEEEEFSFVCTNPDGSPISAEELFQDGQIRPIFPIFDRSLLFADADDGDSSSSSASAPALRPPLKKLFVEERDPPSSSSSDADELEAAEPGTYCAWSGGKAMEASPEMSKKSNSTGFSRFWRFRDLIIRSSSDGKDAFVFLNPSSAAANNKPSEEAVRKMASPAPTPAKSLSATAGSAAKTPARKKKAETASSAHERHYVRNRAKKEVDKRRSYLPYRPDLVGFFTNVNGLSRNVHPF